MLLDPVAVNYSKKLIDSCIPSCDALNVFYIYQITPAKTQGLKTHSAHFFTATSEQKYILAGLVATVDNHLPEQTLGTTMLGDGDTYKAMRIIQFLGFRKTTRKPRPGHGGGIPNVGMGMALTKSRPQKRRKKNTLRM